jgi:hypothetical protein
MSTIISSGPSGRVLRCSVHRRTSCGGVRSYAVLDPGGHQWEFATVIDGPPGRRTRTRSRKPKLGNCLVKGRYGGCRAAVVSCRESAKSSSLCGSRSAPRVCLTRRAGGGAQHVPCCPRATRASDQPAAKLRYERKAGLGCMPTETYGCNPPGAEASTAGSAWPRPARLCGTIATDDFSAARLTKWPVIRFSCPFGGESSVRDVDLDTRAAEVDHCDEGVG